jgi:hypothetical protein
MDVSYFCIACCLTNGCSRVHHEDRTETQLAIATALQPAASTTSLVNTSVKVAVAVRGGAEGLARSDERRVRHRERIVRVGRARTAHDRHVGVREEAGRGDANAQVGAVDAAPAIAKLRMELTRHRSRGRPRNRLLFMSRPSVHDLSSSQAA